MEKKFVYKNDDQAREELKKLVGTTVKAWNVGLYIEQYVHKFEEDKYTFKLHTTHRPITWGNDTFTKNIIAVRKGDGMYGDITILN